jgi:hypothetical protein
MADAGLARLHIATGVRGATAKAAGLAAVVLALAGAGCGGGGHHHGPTGNAPVLSARGGDSTAAGESGGAGGTVAILATHTAQIGGDVEAPPPVPPTPATGGLRVTANANLFDLVGPGGLTDAGQKLVWDGGDFVVEPGVTLTWDSDVPLEVSDGNVYIDGTIVGAKDPATGATALLEIDVPTAGGILVVRGGIDNSAGLDPAGAGGAVGSVFLYADQIFVTGRVKADGASATAASQDGSKGGVLDLENYNFDASVAKLVVTGGASLSARGGDAAAGAAGEGGTVVVLHNNTVTDPTSLVHVAGTVDASGGSGLAAGPGGNLMAYTPIRVVFLASASVDGGKAGGGAGAKGGTIEIGLGAEVAGDVALGANPFLDARGGAAAEGGAGGTVVAFAGEALSGKAGRIDASGGSGQENGGEGGTIELVAAPGNAQPADLVGSVGADLLLLARGGDGGTGGGGAGGRIEAVSANGSVRLGGAADVSGGASSAGAGGAGGIAIVASDKVVTLPPPVSLTTAADGVGGTVTNEATIIASGGAGATSGGAAGEVTISSDPADQNLATLGPGRNAGTVLAEGGAARTGPGGSGGSVVLGSSTAQAAFENRGTIRIGGGAGSPPGNDGSVSID